MFEHKSIMNIESLLQEAIIKSFNKLFNSDIEAEQIKIQPTNKEFEGTHTFLTFPFSRISRKSPEETGKMVGAFLKEQTDFVENYNVVKGFLNLKIKSQIWIDLFDHDYNLRNWGKLEEERKSDG